MDPQHQQKHHLGKGDAVAEALTTTQQVAEEIKGAADELGVVHAVLDTQVSKQSAPEDMEEAVARTQELEKRLKDSAEKLDSANEVLERAAKR